VTRILFVDDEPLILAGLRNVLRKQRSRWEMHFTTSGQEALDALAEHPTDIIISDMRMPGMDGAALLSSVREQFPLTARILLTGQASKADLLRAVPVAQQIIGKPCTPELLCQTIERALNVQALLNNDAVKTLVGRIEHLRACPQSYLRLTELMHRDDASIAEFAAIVAQDPALSARTLSVVNSSYWGLSQATTSIPSAVRSLGLEIVRALALSNQVLGPGYTHTTRSLTLSKLRDNALLRAQLAQRFVNDRSLDDPTYTAALLFDIGHVVLSMSLGENYDSLLLGAEADQRPVHELEQQELGFTHAEVGGYLLALWGIPLQIVELVAAHNAPALLGLTENATVRAIHVADRLVSALRAGVDDPLMQLEPSIRAHPDVKAHLAEWLILATEAIERP
jgi:HD-like signal output (HDOD) protein/CheY-like chemotaxis protein